MHETRLDDWSCRYHRSGRGPVALFLHGFPLERSMWQAQVSALEDRRTCIAPDLRGFGESKAPPIDVLDMEGHAHDMVRLLDALEVERADVIALSMGGYVALAMWELFPERIRSLALVDTRSGADDAAGRVKREASAKRLIEIGRATFAAEMLPALVAADASVAVRARLRTMIEATPYETIAAAQMGMRARPDRTALLSSINVPTCVIVGELDTLTPPAVAKPMADAIPGARYVVIPGAGHMAPMEAPDPVNAALIEFREAQQDSRAS